MEDHRIFVDRDKLQRVIYNLLSNGMKHAASEVSMNFDFVDDVFYLSVYNDGKAISVREAERVFDPFYQAEDGIRTGGAGLGLSIVKGFVEAHGGRVWIEPGDGRGTTFRLTMPCGGLGTPESNVLKD
jgi:signal transduction histidine kinase